MDDVIISGTVEFPLRLIARFGPSNHAGKLGLDQDEEFRQEVSVC